MPLSEERPCKIKSQTAQTPRKLQFSYQNPEIALLSDLIKPNIQAC